MYNKSTADVAYLRGDVQAAAQMYYEGAREGDALASFNYGYCLLRGRGVIADASAAKSFFSYARDLEGGEACYNLAVMYLEGVGVSKNYRTALQYMTDSAEMGCIEAQLYLGMAYTLGYLLNPDIVRINMIPCHSAEYRDNSTFLLTGDVTEAEADEEMRYSIISADARRAFEYFKEAAYHDPTYVSDLVAKGQFLYAKCYLEGMGTEFDRSRGLNIMAIAGKCGSADAVEYLASSAVTEQMLLEAKNELRRRKSRRI